MICLHHGDALEVLASLPDASFDALFSDPPYGLGFMGRSWDHGVPSVEVWSEVLRVLKPGAPLLAFGGTRTFHRLACAIEDAGFEIRDSVGIAWCYGSGYPKSLDISKAIDKAAGHWRGRAGPVKIAKQPSKGTEYERGEKGEAITDAAKRWQGYGTALKPAWEPCVLAMKPLDGTFAENAMGHGVAGLNINGGRVVGSGYEYPSGAGGSRFKFDPTPNRTDPVRSHPAGRWPANLILVHHPDCREVGTRRVRPIGATRHLPHHGKGQMMNRGDGVATHPGYRDVDGLETVTAFACAPGCPVAELDRQSGTLASGKMLAGTRRSQGGGYRGGFPGEATRTDTPGDTGGASRFYFQATWEPADFAFRYEAKAPAAERRLGMPSGERCKHPTLKPLSLTAYLAKLLLPPARPDGEPRRLLVPYSGAGSEIIGAVRAGWDEVVGIENDREAIDWSEARITADAPLLTTVRVVENDPKPADCHSPTTTQEATTP